MAKPRPAGLDKPAVRSIIRSMSAFNTAVYRATGGRIGGTWRFMAGFRKPVPVCLLTVTGRVSGQPRTVPLLYLRDGEDIVVVASSGGLPRHPEWYRNLLVTPEVTVQTGREITPMLARTADDAERAALWPRLTALYADFDTYQEWTRHTREIPVVILTRR